MSVSLSLRWKWPAVRGRVGVGVRGTGALWAEGRRVDVNGGAKADRGVVGVGAEAVDEGG